jgi:hypothetical protein
MSGIKAQHSAKKDKILGPFKRRCQQQLTCDQERLRLAEYKVRLLEERLRLTRINKYGPDSEKLSDARLALLEVEPGVSAAASGRREPT